MACRIKSTEEQSGRMTNFARWVLQKTKFIPVVLTQVFAQLLGTETVYFTQLPEIANRFLIPPDPIVLHYMINTATAPPERPTAWDVEVKLEDLSLKHRMKSVTLDANQATLKTLGDIDDEVRCARVLPG